MISGPFTTPYGHGYSEHLPQFHERTQVPHRGLVFSRDPVNTKKNAAQLASRGSEPKDISSKLSAGFGCSRLLILSIMSLGGIARRFHET